MNCLVAMNSIFGINEDELDRQLAPARTKTAADAFSKRTYIAYYDQHRPIAGHFIHQYEDGRQLLVLQKTDSLKFVIILQLTRWRKVFTSGMN